MWHDIIEGFKQTEQEAIDWVAIQPNTDMHPDVYWYKEVDEI
tara:strand:- start:12 stop:137 length:126 start_codon:yes stop_codon:yes gene_type:complete